ncbi:hypothetical protein LEM8419_00146 [Neolewinella maritima]|uniref:Uncharacterized protein n=1 Tax=Neolewinella maritima TaxID=1383882 RepID=A0ABM9AWJ5_9BACT|nr:hypothetical protein [Neolewinella maritima]CAH0998831.1 hypothetical protein LEM8419_00146 [Neolewinella maritima]
MNNEVLESYGLSASEYYEALRQVVDEQYQDAPYQELDAAVNPALERMSAEERDEFFGALASIATPFIGKAISWGVKKIGGAISRGGRRRRRKPRYRRRRVSGSRGRISHLLKLMNDPRLKRLLAGNLLNRLSPRRIGRTKIRHVRRRGGRRELTEINLSEFVNLLKLLGGGGGKSGNGSSLSTSMGNESGEMGQDLEAGLNKLYGPEMVLEEAYDTEFDDYEVEGFDEFDDESDWAEADDAYADEYY